MENEEVVNANIPRLSSENNYIKDGTAKRGSLKGVTNMIWALGYLKSATALNPIINV